MRHTAAILTSFLVLVSAVVIAQETTGGIQGRVADEIGSPVQGAAVRATGPSGPVSTATNDEGEYRYPRLAPGTYAVSATFEDLPPVTAESVQVVLGEVVTVDFILRRSRFEEQIEVYSDTVAIDFSESQTATNIRQWEIDFLPRGRNFTDVVTFAPGTTLNYQGGGIMVDGASGLENRYIIDGIDTTDPQTGDDAVPMRAEMFEEVQVKSAGYAAEYGGSTGGVINAVTRSGGNEWHGSVFVDYENNDWNGSARSELEGVPDANGSYRYTFDTDDEERWDPGFSISGPVWRDRVWFFIAYQPGLRTTRRTVDWPSSPADTYTQDLRVDYGVANVTANVSSRVLLKLGANVSPYTIEGVLPNRNGFSDLPGQENYAPLGTEGERETYSLTTDWILSDSAVFSGRAGFYHTNVSDTGIPTFDLIHNYSTSSDPALLESVWPEMDPEWRQGPGFYSDNLRNVNQRNIYERTAYGVDATWYFRGAGDHSLKLGYQNEEIFNDVASGHNADRILYYWGLSFTTTSGESVSGDYGVFRLLNISTFGKVKTNNEALFVQDSWSITPNATLNLGVRAEKEGVPNYGATGPDPAIEFDYGDKIAPRLGFAWDVKNDARWKVSGSYGVYYDVTKYEMPRGSFGGDKWVDYWFTFDTADPGLNDFDAGCTVGNNTIFDVPVCGAGTLIEIIDQRLNSADPATWAIIGYPAIEPDMKPMESWEAQVGVEHQLTSVSQIGARVVHKEIVRTIEDVGLLWPGVGQAYIIANPGEGVTAGFELPFVKPVREYDALEISYEKRFTNNWSLRAYYTLSRLWGNYSGLANSDEIYQADPLNPADTAGRTDPNVSRLWDVAATMYDENGDPVYGRLATDRTHQLGAQLLYSFPWGLNVGVNQYAGSGTPISTIGAVSGGWFYPYGRGDLGETPWLTQTDLTLYYTVNLGSGIALSAGLTVLNLFDEDTPTRKWSRRQLQSLAVTDDDFLTGLSYADQLAALGPGGLDPLFGLWDTFQPPREVRLTLKLEF